MKTDEILIRLHQHSEGGIEYDIYLEPPPVVLGAVLEVVSDDGGLCIDEASVERGDAFSPRDYKDALEMATEQVVALLEKEDKECSL